MEFSEAMAILELVALAVIAGLLYQLLKESRLLRRRMEAGREKKDGQTINVNVAPVAVPEGKSPPPTPKEPEPEPKSGDGEPEEPPVASPAPPKPIRALGSVTITPGGAIAVKCPKCGSENSGFRTECFNCGSPLR